MMFKKWILPALWITVLGIILVGVAWFSYVGIYLSIEAIWYADDPQRFPADQLRAMSAIALLLVYVLTVRFQKKPLLRAILLVPTVTVLFITIYLRYYNHLVVGIPVLSIVSLGIVYLLYRTKQPWLMYYASILSLVVALAYSV